MPDATVLRHAARRGAWTVVVVGAAIALAVLAAAQADVSAAAVRDLWARASGGAVAAAFGLMTVGIVFLALRWRAMMTQPEGVRVLPLSGILVVGTLLNYALPGPVGEFAAAALAGRRFGVPAEMAFAAGVHARFLGLGLAGAVALVLFAVSDMPVAPELRAWIGLATAVIALGALALAGLSAFPGALRRVSAATVGRVRLLAPVHASVTRFADAMHAVGRLGPARYAQGALWALCGHACVAGGVYLAAVGLGAGPNPAGLAFTYAAATAGAVVLFAFPGSQVGWDAMFASLLVTAAGVPLGTALALTLLVRVQQLTLVLLGAVALLGYTRDGRARPDG